MKFTLLFLFVLVFFNADAQTVEKYFNYQWKPCEINQARFYATITKTDTGYVRHDYFIHENSLQMSGKYNDSDCTVPNGYFYYFHPNSILKSAGVYTNGKKNGLWLSYHNNKMMSDSTVYNMGKIAGTSLAWHPNGYMSDSTTLNEDGSGVHVSWFENGAIATAGLYAAGTKPTGKWKFYHDNGTISSIETFNEGTQVDKAYYNEEGKIQTDTTNRDSDPVFPGGSTAWKKYIFMRAYFPVNYKLVNADTAVVVATFAINEDGKVADIYVSTPFYPAFDKIAVKAISNSPKWKPAIRHNRRVKFWLNQVITFATGKEINGVRLLY